MIHSHWFVKVLKINSNYKTVKLGYNKLGYSKLGYNKLGYNKLQVRQYKFQCGCWVERIFVSKWIEKLGSRKNLYSWPAKERWILNRKCHWPYLHKLSRCASCVARCIPPCDLCAFLRNCHSQTMRSLTILYLCMCPNNFSSFESVWPKTILVHVIAISQIPI